MIYLDSAATTLQRPREVVEAVWDCLNHYAANPGRGGHKLSLRAARAVYDTRERIADTFHIADPLRVVFTSNATEALNLAIKGLLRRGDHVVATAMEHNSVLRPLYRAQQDGVVVTIVDGGPDGVVRTEDIQKHLRADTKLVICTHASNVTGAVMPIGEIGRLCGRRGVLFLVDASQSAGLLNIDVQAMNIDLLAAAGHKGLFGIQGTGLLYVGEKAALLPIKEGGTGSYSQDMEQPPVLPDRYESGTLNLPGIVSLRAGLDFINRTGREEIKARQDELTRRFLEGAGNTKGVKIYGRSIGQKTTEPADSTGIVLLNIEKMSSSDVAFVLDDTYDICVRAGFHCAPLAHKAIGTAESGAVRFSFGYFNTEEEVDQTLEAIQDMASSI